MYLNINSNQMTDLKNIVITKNIITLRKYIMYLFLSIKKSKITLGITLEKQSYYKKNNHIRNYVMYFFFSIKKNKITLCIALRKHNYDRFFFFFSFLTLKLCMNSHGKLLKYFVSNFIPSTLGHGARSWK